MDSAIQDSKQTLSALSRSPKTILAVTLLVSRGNFHISSSTPTICIALLHYAMADMISIVKHGTTTADSFAFLSPWN